MILNVRVNDNYIVPPEPSEVVIRSIEKHKSFIEKIEKEMCNILGMKKSDFEKHFKRR